MVMSAQPYLNVSQLRELLLGMERDLGLGKLTQNEKDVFYAVQLVIAANGGVARSEDIKNHELTRAQYQSGLIHFTGRCSRPNACGSIRYCLRRQTNLKRGYTI